MSVKCIGRASDFTQRTSVYQSRTAITEEALIRKNLEEFSNITQRPNDDNLEIAVASAFNAFKVPEKLKMIHLKDVFKLNVDNWKKSPGYPWRDYGYQRKSDICKDPKAIQSVRRFWHLIKDNNPMKPPDCLVHVRLQKANLVESKINTIWVYPGTVTFGEAVFAVPLIKTYQTCCKSIVLECKIKFGKKGKSHISSRFSSYPHFAFLNLKNFDKTIPVWLIDTAFDILSNNINFVEYAGYGETDERRMKRMWEYIKNYFKNSPIRTVNGMRYQKSVGIASGSYFADLVRSVINYILCQWICLDQTGNLAVDILVHNDIALIATFTPLELSISSDLIETIGMQIDEEKSEITTELETMKILDSKKKKKNSKSST